MKNQLPSLEELQEDCSKDVTVSISIVKSCMKDLDDGHIDDRHEFYIKSFMKRADKCNEVYLNDFDQLLSNVTDKLNSNEFDIKSFRRLIKESSKLSSTIFDNFYSVYCKLMNK